MLGGWLGLLIFLSPYTDGEKMVHASMEKKKEEQAGKEKEKKKPEFVVEQKPPQAQKLDVPTLEPEGIMKEARSLEVRARAERERLVELVKKEYKRGKTKKTERKERKQKKSKKEK